MFIALTILAVLTATWAFPTLYLFIDASSKRKKSAKSFSAYKDSPYSIDQKVNYSREVKQYDSDRRQAGLWPVVVYRSLTANARAEAQNIDEALTFDADAALKAKRESDEKVQQERMAERKRHAETMAAQEAYARKKREAMIGTTDVLYGVTYGKGEY